MPTTHLEHDVVLDFADSVSSEDGKRPRFEPGDTAALSKWMKNIAPEYSTDHGLACARSDLALQMAITRAFPNTGAHVFLSEYWDPVRRDLLRRIEIALPEFAAFDQARIAFEQSVGPARHEYRMMNIHPAVLPESQAV